MGVWLCFNQGGCMEFINSTHKCKHYPEVVVTVEGAKKDGTAYVTCNKTNSCDKGYSTDCPVVSGMMDNVVGLKWNK